MINKEVAELRRRFKPEHFGISRICGCLVSASGEIVSQFTESPELLPSYEQEKYLGLLKKSLSGTMGKTLHDIAFRTQQVPDSDEHKLLTRLRKSRLGDAEALKLFYDRIALSLDLGSAYAVLLGYDCYDVPYKTGNEELLDDAGDIQHDYFVCSVCPLKESPPSLHYDSKSGSLRQGIAEQLVCPPELGFTFPAFDERRTNIYGALYYNKSASDAYDGFVNAVFNTSPIMPVNAQREGFKEALAGSLGGQCSADLVQELHAEIHAIVAEHKDTKNPETLTLTNSQVCDIVRSCGAEEEAIAEFSQKYTEVFGENADVPPQNLLNDKQLEYKTPHVTVKVHPDYQHLVHTRSIDGKGYLMISLSEGVELNGIAVSFPEKEEKN